MKFSIVHYRWSKHGGAEQYITRLVDTLINRGHDVDILAARQEFAVPEGATFHRIPAVRFPLWLRLPVFALQVGRYLSRTDHDLSIGSGKVWGCDVIRPGGGCHRAYEDRMSVARRVISPFRTKWSDPIKSILPFNLMNRFVEDVMFHQKPYIIAVSSLVRDDILRFYPTLASRIEVIPNGRDPKSIEDPEITSAARKSIREKLGVPKTGFIMLLMATNPWLKGFRHILEVLRILIDEQKAIDPHLVVVGPRRSIANEGLVWQYGLTSRVHSVPFVDDVDQWYRGSDILVHLTLYDAFANVCLEAMAVGLPVLTSRFNGGAEVYTPGIDGFVVDSPWQHKEIADMLMGAFQSHALPEIGRQGHQRLFRYTQKSSLEHAANMFERIVQQRED